MSSLPAAALGMSTVHHFPRARYLLKLAEEEGAPQIASLLQRQGLHCVVDRSHVVVSADPEKLKSQVRLMLRIFLWDILPAVLEVNVFLSLSLSLLSLGWKAEMGKTTEKFWRGYKMYWVHVLLCVEQETLLCIYCTVSRVGLTNRMMWRRIGMWYTCSIVRSVFVILFAGAAILCSKGGSVWTIGWRETVQLSRVLSATLSLYREYTLYCSELSWPHLFVCVCLTNCQTLSLTFTVSQT